MSKGQTMYNLAARLFPICRSITGDGFRKSLDIIRETVSGIKVYEVPTGTQAFDWTVPKEWNCKGGGIYRLNGEKVIEFKDTNLHVLGYSQPVDRVVSREELLEHVYTLPEQPDWIPYVTSYYVERWGFCMSENQKQSLEDDLYRVLVDATLEDGSLTYGELIIPGETEEEIMLSTYLCHPSMANDELSGPVVQAELAKYIQSLPRRRYTYRLVFIPETIGSLVYCSRNLDVLQRNVKAGFVLCCIGDTHTYSYIASKYEDTLADRVMQNILKFHYPDYIKYSYLKRGSDERQYCSVGIDLPVCGFCRSKHQEYPEYHTSADDMNFISPEGLEGSYDVMVKVINALENNHYYHILCKGEPQLGKRGLYPTISQKGTFHNILSLRDFIAYADGRNDLIDISNIINVPIDLLLPMKDKLMENGLLEIARKMG